MRRGLGRSTLLAASVLALLASACSTQADYQYLEVPDGDTFAKVPADWDIDAEGWVDFVFAPAENLVVLPGEKPIAWRATFNQAAGGERPQGGFNVQFVAPAERATVLLGRLIDPVPGATELSRVKVRLGELTGWRAVQQNDHDGARWTTEHLILTNDNRSTIYYVALQCSDECYERNREEIDAVMTTLRVES